jgi:SAM-dependent methyltransferase
VQKVDLAAAADFAPLQGKYDTVVCLNVLEHIKEEALALANLRGALAPGGRAVILVPQGPGVYGTLDEVLGHERRYTRESLTAALRSAGFEIDALFDFNRATTPGWWFNGKILRRRHFGRVQLKVMNLSVWLLRRVDSWLPWHGASLIAVARRV